MMRPASGQGRCNEQEALVHRLFFALTLDPDTAMNLWRRAERFSSRHRLAARPMRPDRLHISLNGLGVLKDLDEQFVDLAMKAASRVAAQSFVVALNRLVSWNGARRPLVLTGDEGVFGVKGLYLEIQAALSGVGLPSRGARRFEPHLTLLRDQVETPPQWLRPPVSWRVQDFVLIHSRHSLGPHNVLGRWPLLD